MCCCVCAHAKWTQQRTTNVDVAFLLRLLLKISVFLFSSSFSCDVRIALYVNIHVCTTWTIANAFRIERERLEACENGKRLDFGLSASTKLIQTCTCWRRNWKTWRMRRQHWLCVTQWAELMRAWKMRKTRFDIVENRISKADTIVQHRHKLFAGVGRKRSVCSPWFG